MPVNICLKVQAELSFPHVWQWWLLSQNDWELCNTRHYPHSVLTLGPNAGLEA